MGNRVGKKLLAGNRMESNNPNENMLTNNTQHIPAFKEQNVLHNNQFLNDTTFAWNHACIYWTHFINKNVDTLKPTKIYLFEFLKE